MAAFQQEKVLTCLMLGATERIYSVIIVVVDLQNWCSMQAGRAN